VQDLHHLLTPPQAPGEPGPANLCGWLDTGGPWVMFIYDQVMHVIILILIAYGIAAAS
jgi:hypothetical protein